MWETGQTQALEVIAMGWCARGKFAPAMSRERPLGVGYLPHRGDPCYNLGL